MLQIGLALVMFLLGLRALNTGSMKIIGNRYISDGTARIAGWLALIPLPTTIILFLAAQSVTTYSAAQTIINLSNLTCWLQILLVVGAALLSRPGNTSQ